MPPSWTTEQILALAPDAGSQKSGRELASLRKWGNLGKSEEALWGECQGSGKTPYQTQIELAEPAFRCTCPSRKFPCKHGLGLFLLLDSNPAAFTQAEPPAWVTEWLESRSKRAEQQEKKKEEAAAKPVDPEKQAKTAAKREAAVTAGLNELELWMRDLVRGGLAAAQTQPATFWDTPARRMRDAKAGGMDRLVRLLAPIPHTGPGWQERLLERLSRIHLLTEGYKRLESLPEPTQADIRQTIGFWKKTEEVLAEEGLRDQWLVLGRYVEEPLDSSSLVRAQRTWLWGLGSGRPALIWDFAAPGQVLDRSLTLGALLDAELVYYPGADPLRALVKQRFDTAPAPTGAWGYASVLEGTEAYARALGSNPWLEQFPMPLQAVTPLRDGEGWAVQDREGYVLPLVPRFDRGWHLLAHSGGRPLALFGEWNGDHLLPLSVWAEGRFHTILKVAE